jgi:hypothetical protein
VHVKEGREILDATLPNLMQKAADAAEILDPK